MATMVKYGSWRQIDQWLAAHRPYWEPSPFSQPDLPWTGSEPELRDWLRNLEEERCDALEAAPEELAGLVSRWVPGLAQYQALVSLPRTGRGNLSLPEVAAREMPGRKRLQAGAFAGALAPLEGHVLDWCCGKGHLARTLYQVGARHLTGFEWNQALVSAGDHTAQQRREPVQLRHQDVMMDPLPWPEPDHAVALHACGDLHRRLMTTATGQRCRRISFSPCCYHLTRREEWYPLSDQVDATADRCSLSRDELRLAVRETVTAPAGVRRRSRQRSAWRLGFDGLQRCLRNSDSYLPVPPEPAALLKGDFQGFCQWAAHQKNLSLPADVDYARWQEHGWQRQREVRRYELLRHLFRRPLELWLVIDYGLFLQEQGYQVSLGEFCDRGLTPRNLLLDARLPGG